MRNFTRLLLSTTLVLAWVGIGLAQRGRVDTTEMRDRMRERQRIIESNNPFRIEPYEPLKPPPPPRRSPLRATVELQVVEVADGDTFIIRNTVDQKLRIRLQGIDAPEKGQSFSKEALGNLGKLVADKWVSIEFDPRGKPDAEGRIVAKVYVEGRDVGLEQLKAGFAWYCQDYKKDQTESDRYTYAEAEKDSRKAARGLWRESSPQQPWEYRRKQ